MTDTSMAGRAAPGLLSSPMTWYAWLLNAFFVFFINLQGNIIPFIQDEFGLSYRVVSLHSSALAAGIIIVGLFGDRAVTRLGRRRALWVGTLGIVAGAVLLCLSPGPVWSIASCVLLGASLNPAVVPALLADLHGERRAEAYAGQSAVAYAFAIAGPLLTGLFVGLGLGWRYPVLIAAAFGLAVLFWFRRMKLPESAASGGNRRRRLPPAFWFYWALLFVSCSLEYCILLWAPAYLERIVGLAPASAAAAASIFAVGVLVGRLVVGAIVGRMSPRRLFVAALALAMLGFLVYWGLSGPVSAAIGILLLGFGVAPLYPLTMAFAVGAAGEATDIASTRLTLAFGLSLLIAPFVLGAVADEVGLGPAHLTLPVIIGAAFAVFLAAEALERRGPVQPAGA